MVLFVLYVLMYCTVCTINTVQYINTGQYFDHSVLHVVDTVQIQYVLTYFVELYLLPNTSCCAVSHRDVMRQPKFDSVPAISSELQLYT